MNWKIPVISLLLFGVVGITGYAVYAYILAPNKQAAKTEKQSTPSSFQNPFVEKPQSSFTETIGSTEASTPTNPFAEPSPTPYQNPFSVTPTGSKEYQNPFEALR